VDAAGVCCERCPEATLANTRHIARRRLLKAAVFHPQPTAHADPAFPPGPEVLAHPRKPGQVTERGRNGNAGQQARPSGAPENGWHPAADRDPGGGADTAPVYLAGNGGQDVGLRASAGLGQPFGSHHHGHGARQAHPGAYGSGNLYRAVTGQIIDASPQVLVIGDGGAEHRFALTADTRAWRGGTLEPAALSRGDIATIRLLPNRSNLADRIWANIGRVTGVIAGRDGDRLLVAESRSKPPQAVIIPNHARVKVQVRYPNLQPGYLLDIIGLWHKDYLEGLLPANSQPTYRSDAIQKDQQSARTADAITGAATWHDFADEPYGVLGVSYPAIDPAASCREDSVAGYPPGQSPTFRELPYMAVGSVLNVRNECTGISSALPVTGCAPMARLFNDRCVTCANSPRGRVADLTIATFVALGGELEQGCFSTTLTIGR
jgi:hypothetical protein